jgi:formylglycine-generating enzyme required for sulfatase activity
VLEDGKLRTLYRPTNDVFVGDVDLHFDGQRLLFSMPKDKNDWHIWELQADGAGLRQVTPDEPQVDWYDPCYLPNDALLFASTAPMAGVPCVGGGNRVANLYRMEADRATIRRLCFDQEHNWCPTVMNDGRVMYTRWEYTDTPHYFTRLLFHMNPDGTQQAEHYGSNSYWPNSIFYARPIPGDATRFIAIISGHHGTARAGELVLFDPARGRREADGAVVRIGGQEQVVDPDIRDGLVEGVWPRYLHPYPLDAEHFLVSCQPEKNAPWGIYVVNRAGGRTKLHEEPGYALLEPIPLRPTTRPPVIPDRVKLGEKEATVYLTDVYAGEGLRGVPRGSVKQLRVYSYHFAYPQMGGHINIGVDGPWDARRILGTVPVAEDGSAVFKAPANTPLAVQPLDADGQAIQVMRSWFTAMPGEQVTCMGCHETQNTGPSPQALAALQRAPAAIAPWRGPARPFSFPREVQPVLDKHCVGCHGDPAVAGQSAPDLRGDQPDQPLELRRKKRAKSHGFDPAYLGLHPFVRRPGPESDYHLPKPYEYHASSSELVQLLRAGHHGVQLDAEAWDRLITWIDLNVPDHGTWGEHRPVPGGFDQLRRALDAKYAGLDLDPESYPAPPPAPVAFVKPAPVQPEPPAAAPASTWAARPTDLAKKVTLDLSERVKLPLVLVPAERPFYLGRCEVDNETYALFDPDHESGYTQIFNKDATSRGVPADQPRQPVVRVTWEEATRFCAWLSEKTGRRVTLPTGEQWEFACRGGATTPMWYGETAADFGAFANLADQKLLGLCVRDSPKWLPVVASVDDGATGLASVGRYQPNAWGLCDLHGNAAEWTQDEVNGRKVARGGSFYDRPYRATATSRRTYLPHQPVFDVGFRVVVEIPANELATK